MHTGDLHWKHNLQGIGCGLFKVSFLDFDLSLQDPQWANQGAPNVWEQTLITLIKTNLYKKEKRNLHMQPVCRMPLIRLGRHVRPPCLQFTLASWVPLHELCLFLAAWAGLHHLSPCLRDVPGRYASWAAVHSLLPTRNLRLWLRLLAVVVDRQLEIQRISSNSVPLGGKATQALHLTNLVPQLSQR